MTRVVHDIYFAKAFEAPTKTLVEEMREVMKGHQFDTIVGTGLSGTVFAAKVADGMGANFAILRKNGVQSHSCNELEGTVGSRWVFGDDFVASGATLARVLEYMRAKHPYCKFVGAYSYGEDVSYPARYLSPIELADRGETLANLILGRPEGPEPHRSWYRNTVYSYEYKCYVAAWDTPEYHVASSYLPQNQPLGKWGPNVARCPVGTVDDEIVWEDNPYYRG